jgi:hypothetical protein
MMTIGHRPSATNAQQFCSDCLHLSHVIRTAASFVAPFTYGLFDLGDRAAASTLCLSFGIFMPMSAPADCCAVAALQTASVNHVADVIHSNLQLPPSLQPSLSPDGSASLALQACDGNTFHDRTV